MCRKKIFVYGFLCLFVDLCTAQNHIKNVNINTYLNMQLEYANRELSTTTTMQNVSHNKDFETNIVFNNSRTVSLFYNYTSANVVSLFNKVYVVIGPEFYNITLDNNTPELNPALEFLKLEHSGLFVKVAEYNNLGILFIPLSSGVSLIYGRWKSMQKWNLIQSIQSEKNISDAAFFINDNNLYLCIASSMGIQIKTLFSIFKWNGAHFDEIDQVHTKNPSNIVTFESQSSQFIMFLENSLDIKAQSNLVIYEFIQDHLEKVQLLRASNSNKVVSFNFSNIQYVAMFSEQQNSTLYWWNDSELVLLKKFGRYENIYKVLVDKINGIPVLFVAQKSNLLVFTQSTNDIHLIHESNVFKHYKYVLDMKVIQNGNTHILLIFVLSCDNKLSYITMPFTIHSNEIDIKVQSSEKLLECLKNLEKNTQALKNKLASGIQNKTTMMPNSFKADYGGISLGAQASIPSQSNTKQNSTKYQDGVSWVTRNINNLHSRIEVLKEKVGSLYKEGDQINGKVIIRGKLFADELVAKNLHVNYLNHKRWTPHTWLSYSKPQTITGQVYVGSLITSDIETSEENELNNILLHTGNQNITGKFILQTLTAEKLTVRNINNIEFDDIFLKSKAGVIQGVKTLSNISADEIIYSDQHKPSQNLHHLLDKNVSKLNFADNLNVTNIYVEEINNINWEEFQKSVFRLSIDKQISGELIITNVTKVNHLYSRIITNVDAQALLTTTTNQTITSNMKFGNLLVPNIRCKSINSYSMNEIVTSKNAFVKGPVTIDNVQVAKHLHMNGSEDETPLTFKDDHIVGTKESDFMQIYNKNVKIHGNLYLTNMVISKTGKVIVDNKPFRDDDIKNYWLKSHPQVIPVHVEPRNGITTSHLTVISINSIGLDNYLTNTLDDKTPTNVIFENVTIGGDVFLNKSVHHSPNLQILNAESVKTSGSFTIVGQKTVQGILSVGDLTTSYLDEIDLSNVVTSETKNKITGAKQFDTIIINGNLVSKNISTQFLNNINLKTLEKEVLYLDKPEHLSSMLFSNIKVENLEARTINNVDLFGYMKYLDHVHEMNTIEDLFVNGNVSIENAQNVIYVNSFSINDVLNKAIDQEHNQPIKNAVRFLGNVHAENIEVKTVNNVHFPSLISRLFYRAWAQNITVPFTFDKIITPNIVVPQINNIPTKKLINIKETKPQNLLVWGGLKLTYPKFLKSLSAEKLSCDLNQALYALKSPPTRFWSLLRVSQNATFWDRSCDLFNIFSNVVNIGKSNIIKATVTSENAVAVNYVNANSLVNGIDINELINDTVLKNTAEQVITGYKTFKSLTVSNAIVDFNADIPIVNNIDIRQLNQSIVYKSNINTISIQGMKTFFGGLQTNQLLTSRISNILPSDLVNLGNLRDIPEAYFHALEVTNDFNVEFVNNISVPYTINERLLCCINNEQLLEGTYYFDTAILNGNTIIPFFNKLVTDDIVFDESDTQVITSPKTFVQDLVAHGNVEVDLLNGEDLSERYRLAVHLGETSIIKGNVVLNDTTLVTADIKTESLNGVPIKHIEELMNSKIPVVRTKVVYDMMSEIKNDIEMCTNISHKMSNKYLYLEKSKDLELAIPNAVSAQVLQLKNNVILHITQSQLGAYCGLPNSCMCSTQNNIQISEEQSINTIAEVGVKRVFSFENENMSSHLFTSSISYSDFCRSNVEIAQNESSSLMWMMYSHNKSRSSYFYSDLLTGYISGVEYFTSNNNTFMVVSRFYDPINNTNNLDCRVYKFVKDEGKITLIQIIDTKNAVTIHVFPTAQGLVLIIGSTSFSGRSNIHSGAGVYRFNATTENFVPLRRISSSVTSATGIVVHANSLIVLSENKVVEVFKYHPKYDNYYYYQSIFFDSIVTGISTFYAGDFGISDVHLCVVTEDGIFYIYSYQYVEGLKLISKGEIEGLQLLVPFILNSKHYIFAVSTQHTFLLTALIHGPN